MLLPLPRASAADAVQERDRRCRAVSSARRAPRAAARFLFESNALRGSRSSI